MKKIAITTMVLFAGGCNYIAIGGGYGGPTDAGNFTIEYEIEPPDEIKSKVEPKPGQRDWRTTGGMTIIDNAIDTGFYVSDPEVGGFVKLGVEVMADSGFFVNILGGITWFRWETAWTEEETEWHGMFGGGVTYFINDEDVCILADYDNRRGFTAGIGWRF